MDALASVIDEDSCSPTKKFGCKMVVTNDNRLVLFGGYGIPSGPTQPGAEFILNTNGNGWTNELHSFDLWEGEGMYVYSVENHLSSGGWHNYLAEATCMQAGSCIYNTVVFCLAL